MEDPIIFTYHGQVMTGRVIERNPGVNVITEGLRDGRQYIVTADDVRPETKYERVGRENYGYYAEDL